ncbi:MAG: helix-turn-helix transcriptional regulator [Azospirillaceae bacterium]|nr:helix-turn-helix transcriptional regulator [Azospirillaceae bacterium]
MAPPKKPQTPFAERLIQARGDMSRSDAAESLGIPNNTLGSYERGEAEPAISKILAIADLYQVSLQWLLRGEGEARPKAETAAPLAEAAAVLDTKRLRSAILSVQRLAQEEPEVLLGGPGAFAEMVVETYQFLVNTSDAEKRRMVMEEKAKTDRQAG